MSYENFLAGICSGITSTLVLHPLDLLKVRFAVSDGQSKVKPNYRNIGNALKTIVRDEGFRGLYKGVAPNCWGAGTSWGLYFLFYERIKHWMMKSNHNQPLGPIKHMTAGACAGSLSAVITNPIWVVKTRLCLQYGNFNIAGDINPLPESKRYSGTIDAFRKVYKFEGIPGLYRGFLPGLFNVSHGSLQMMAYEEMKKAYIKRNNLPNDHQFSQTQYLVFASLSKLFAASLTYPFQVVRARLQDQHSNYTGLTDVIKKTWRYESYLGFYKGFRAYILHVTPNICIVFFVYEAATHAIKNREPSSV